MDDDQSLDDVDQLVGGDGAVDLHRQASLVYSLTMLAILRRRLSAVSSNWKSMAQTWFGYSAR